MKFTVEVEDFWLEEEQLSDALCSRVKSDVVIEITKNIEELTKRQITEKINEVMNKKISLVIDNVLTDLVATGIITVNRQEISIEDYIKKVFMENHGWGNPREQIAKIAKSFTAELKKQYDMVFANEIVVKMKEQGFLKDDLVQVLLKDSSNERG